MSSDPRHTGDVPAGKSVADPGRDSGSVPGSDPGPDRRCPGDAAIVILGKAQGRKSENRQLLARVSAAALLWHAAEPPRPSVVMVARDEVDGVPDVDRAAAVLQGLGVPSEFVLTRPWSNCTLIEVRAVRVLARARGWRTLTLLTHPYHRARAQRLLDEVLPGSSVEAVAPGFAGGSDPSADLRSVVDQRIAASMPRGLDLARELLVESILSALHVVDPRGRIERGLARRVRSAP